MLSLVYSTPLFPVSPNLSDDCNRLIDQRRYFLSGLLNVSERPPSVLATVLAPATSTCPLELSYPH